jgi:hypothetical protein
VSVLIVPSLDEEPWPTLGPQVADLIEECAIFGPGSLKGQPARLDDEKRAALYRMYEVYPQGHRFAGRRRYKRCGISWRKGLAKTEFMAWVAFAELHPDGPVRCDGFDANGEPVGRPVVDPYIPMLAVTAEQVEELAYGALYVMCTEGPDADLFDSTNERIVRLSPSGRADGKAVPLSNSPGSRDGARTTFQCFDEPHRLVLPRQVDAHETMVANLEKRVLEDPWGLYVGTAGEIGQQSIAEGLHKEAEQIASGELTEPQLFYFHREAGPGFDLTDQTQRVAAVTEATGPVGEYGPGQFESIARQWDRPSADKAYLERVWLNRWVKSGRQAFDMKRWAELNTATPIANGSFVTAGFDGARFRDATALVITDVESGRQQLWELWERPLDLDEWEVPEDEVTASLELLMRRMKVWRVYCDPPHWTETVNSWAGRWPDVVMEWWTQRKWPMAKSLRSYREAINSGALTWAPDAPGAADLSRHVAAAGRKDINLTDDDGTPLFILDKIHPERKFDAAMAGVLSWEARLDALKAGAKPKIHRAMSF